LRPAPAARDKARSSWRRAPRHAMSARQTA
jgi:hypothetical protein